MSGYRLIRLTDVSELTGLRRAAIYERIARGDFPPPVKIGRASRWPEEQVLAWRKAAVESGAAA